jgi:hypothetical protein
MAYQVYFNKLSFQRTDPANPTVPVGEPVTLVRGERVPAWVTPFQINALMNAGMVVEVGDDLRTDLVPVEAVPPMPRTPDQPDMLPTDPNGLPPTVNGQGPDAADDPDGSTDEATGQVARPADRDSKDKWEAYAPQVGIPLADAEAMTKAELVAEVKRRESLTSSTGSTTAPSSTPTV